MNVPPELRNKHLALEIEQLVEWIINRDIAILQSLWRAADQEFCRELHRPWEAAGDRRDPRGAA